MGRETPLLQTALVRRAQEAARAVAAEQLQMFVAVFSMVVGWAVGNFIVSCITKYFGDLRSAAHNPAIFSAAMTGMALFVIYCAARLTATRSNHAFAAVLATLATQAAGVAVGRGWNETLRLTRALVAGEDAGDRPLLLQSGYAAIVVALAILLSRLLSNAGNGQHQGLVTGFFTKIVGMLTAWAVADAVRLGFQRVFSGAPSGAAKILAELMYAACSTAAAATAATILTQFSPLTANVFGIACGYGWKMLLNEVVKKENWGSVEMAADELDALIYLVLFSFGVTLVLACGTILLKNAAVRAAAVADGDDDDEESGAGGESPQPRKHCFLKWSQETWASLLQNLVVLSTLAASLNVGWAWGEVFNGVWARCVPGRWGLSLVGKGAYAGVAAVGAALVTWLYLRRQAKNGEDKSFGDSGDDGGASGD
mmetsp:Transcript_12242/g.40215  ORF Transcript_12242/g.40215 Transcript_12242/m.40215 type:complete len:426 (-) Transcript_12242:873-2150(-)